MCENVCLEDSGPIRLVTNVKLCFCPPRLGKCSNKNKLMRLIGARAVCLLDKMLRCRAIAAMATLQYHTFEQQIVS